MPAVLFIQQGSSPTAGKVPRKTEKQKRELFRTFYLKASNMCKLKTINHWPSINNRVDTRDSSAPKTLNTIWYSCSFYLAGGWRKTKNMEFKQKTPFEIWYRPDLFSREGLNRKLSQEKQEKEEYEIWQKNKEKLFIQQSSECCPHRQI